MQAVLSDVEGTLIDCAQQSIQAWQETLSSFGYDVSRLELQSQSGRDTQDMLQSLLPAATKTVREEIAKAQGKLYREEYLPIVRPFAGVRPLFESIKARQCKIALATSCQRDELEVYLGKLNIDGLIDALACGGDVEHGKPHPDLFRLALRKLACSADNAVVIGDTPYDSRAAAAAGIEAMGVESGGFSAQSLTEAGCALVFRDVEDLLNRSERWMPVLAERNKA
jgi:HAD superfamily hydrolase (TIGR01509 family)